MCQTHCFEKYSSMHSAKSYLGSSVQGRSVGRVREVVLL